MCGGTRKTNQPASNGRGLSPRVRGNLRHPPRHYYGERSIPACAGEPAPNRYWVSVFRVYPRVCGGTAGGPADLVRRGGLSPRVRGNHGRYWVYGMYMWSIPACAGEPCTRPEGSSLLSVYPRVCGGTTALTVLTQRPRGLSPRVRGNRLVGIAVNNLQRSIPACAGEPTAVAWTALAVEVYPRVCGGTVAGEHPGDAVRGLSPRVRGNRGDMSEYRHKHRSIPACAGEPIYERPHCYPTRVYPRVCGGTGLPGAPGKFLSGLSPRVRGNQGYIVLGHFRRGSIPACAGEPSDGGSDTCPRAGSIPACAGEPGFGHHPAVRAGVYPRVCGGT